MTVVPARSGVRAVVVGRTAWHVVAADVDPSWVADAVGHDPIAAPLGARFLAALADRVGAEPGSLDAVLVAPRVGRPLDLVPVEHLDHPRVQRALHHRRDVRVWTTSDGVGLVTVGRGVADRWETSVEVEPAARGRGLGTALAAAAPALVPDGRSAVGAGRPGQHRVAARLPRRGLPAGGRRGVVRTLTARLRNGTGRRMLGAGEALGRPG